MGRARLERSRGRLRGGASPAAFAMTDVADIHVWWRLDTGVTTVSGAVSSVADQSGASGVPLIQTVAGSRPVYNATGLNGYPTASFNGTHHMTAHGIAAALSGSDKPFSVYWVGKIDTLVANDIIWHVRDSAGTGSHYHRMQSVTNHMFVRTDDAGVAVIDYGAHALDTNDHAFWFRFNGTQFWEGADATEYYTAEPCNVGNMTADQFFLFSLDGSLNLTDGLFSEMVVYKAKTSDADHALILADLKARWGTP